MVHIALTLLTVGRKSPSNSSPEEIGAVNAWLSSQPIPSDMKPEPVSAAKLPVACGSHRQ